MSPKNQGRAFSRGFSRGGLFTRFAKWTAHATGHPFTFLFALLIVAVWGITGPIFHYSDTWQLVINTGTTIVTFLMVFLIQNTQNRDSHALQIKLDELIRATEGAHNALLDLEELTDEELDTTRESYMELAREAKEALAHGKKDTTAAALKSHLIESVRKEGQRSAKAGKRSKE